MLIELIDVQKLAHAELHKEPFRWASFEQTFQSPTDAAELARNFPQDHFGVKRRRLGESSTYGGHLLVGRGLVGRESGELFMPQGLHPLWIQLARELLSDEYRSAMEELTGLRLSDTVRELICFRQPVGAFLDPHPDNAGKPVSQVFYFSPASWQTQDGGCLRILRSGRIEDMYCEIEPHVNRSVVIVRSEDSWHGYAPVIVADKGPRLCLQLFFCRKDMKFATEYGPDWTKAPRVTRKLWSD